MRRFIQSLILVLSLTWMVHGEGQYSVIGPGTLHSGHKYKVAVAVYHTEQPCQLKVGIIGPKYNDIKTVDIQPNEVKNVEFDVPTLEKGDYNLTAEGVAGIVFKNTTKLNFNEFDGYVKTQTDKGKYKPGDLLNFRVIFLDENLKPYQPRKDCVIWIEDGKRNRIKEFKNIEVVKGVYTGKFQISEYPVLGDWRLMVKNGGGYDKRTYFEVEKYVLPKFTVSMDATDRVSVKDGDMQAVVRANYTYGKPVDAKVTLVISIGTYISSEDENKDKVAPTLIKTADMVNGKAKFSFNVKEYETFLTNKDYPTSLNLVATVEENFTGVKINASSYTSLYPYRYAMNCVNYGICSSFEADKETEVVVQVQYVDDTPIKDTKSVVKLIYKEEIRKHYYWRNDEEDKSEPPPKIDKKVIEYEGHLNETGFAVFKVKLPDLEEFENYSHYYDVEMEYADEKRKIFSTYQHRKPKNIDEEPPKYEEPKDYFKISVNYPTEKYSMNLSEVATLTVNSSEPLTYFVYNIIGRGNVLKSERVDVPDNAKVYNLTYKPTFMMSPYSNVYIHYVDKDGKLQYAETSVHVSTELQNQIEITAPEQVKPGEDVPLRIKTAPNSFVGLMAVDQSVLLLGGNNDLHERDFSWQLGSYSTSTPWQGGYSRYPGDQSGVVTLTNADYFYNRTKPWIGMPYFSPASPRGSPGPGVRSHVMKTSVSEMDVAYGGAGFAAGSPPKTEIAVRKDFSEVWIFADIQNTETADFTWSKKIPDTITSWILTGFSMNTEKGIGITKDQTKITTFQPFFVSVRLPYSVKRGEVFNVPAIVFNYLNKDLDVEVTLDNVDDEYDFTDVSNEVINEPKRVKTVRVPAESSMGVSFMIRPKIVGDIMLKFMAVSPIAGDAIHKSLKVEPEGVTEYANRAYLVNLKNSPEFKETFELEVPSDIVPDSQHIEFSVVGDLLGPTLNNLDHLLRLPMGCAEQTTSALVPNYLVLQYLTAVNKLTEKIETRAKRNIETGYQRILSFRLKDGAFSSFEATYEEEKKLNGSTWLTAYIIRTLNEAKKYTDVDEKILTEGLKYLASKQAENGTFLESKDFYFGSYRNHLTLTASVLLTFVESKDLANPYQANIDKGFKYLLDNVDKDVKDNENLHIKAMVTYALQKAQNPMAQTQLSKLNALAKTEGDRKWWSQTERPTGSHFWWRWIFSRDVEVTSYALLTILDTDSVTVDEVLPIVKWLVAQRNNYGGFVSTQDTVVGMKALINFAKKFEYEPAVMDVDLSSKGGKEKQETIKVTDDNALVMQTVELPPKTLSVDFQAKGKGTALIQVSYQYNILEKEKKPSFTIDVIINKETPPFKLEMEVCVEYQGEDQGSNMALLEVELPSGYVADVEAFEHIETVPHVRKVESKNSNSMIVVYFDTLHKNEKQCVPVEALKSFAVAKQKPASVVLYDYYDTSKKATEFYEVVSKLCDICENDEECKKACQ